jgi:hypothetical protein
LFGLLGIDQGVLLLVAKGVTADMWGTGCVPSSFDHFIHAYCTLMENKVSTCVKSMLPMLPTVVVIVHVVKAQCNSY